MTMRYRLVLSEFCSECGMEEDPAGEWVRADAVETVPVESSLLRRAIDESVTAFDLFAAVALHRLYCQVTDFDPVGEDRDELAARAFRMAETMMNARKSWVPTAAPAPPNQEPGEDVRNLLDALQRAIDADPTRSGLLQAALAALKARA